MVWRRCTRGTGQLVRCARVQSAVQTLCVLEEEQLLSLRWEWDRQGRDLGEQRSHQWGRLTRGPPQSCGCRRTNGFSATDIKGEVKQALGSARISCEVTERRRVNAAAPGGGV